MLSTLTDGRIVVVLSYRSHDVARGRPVHEFLTSLERSRRIERVELNRLTREQSGDLAQAILGQAPAADFLDRVHERSEGVPFFVEELLALTETCGGAELPDTLRELLLARYERLSGPTQQMLRLISVGGMRVRHDLLASVFLGGADQLDSAASEAVGAHLLVVDEESVALSAVAHELGLTTTALYRYVDSKETLVQLMVDATVGPPPQVTTDDWRDGVQAWVRGLWGRYRAHPWLAEAQVSGMPLYPQRLGWMETVLCELDRGPVSDPMRVALLLDGLTRSFALLARPADDAAPPSWVVEAAAARYPRLAHEFTRNWTDIESELAPAVRTVLAGAERPAHPSIRAEAHGDPMVGAQGEP